MRRCSGNWSRTVRIWNDGGCGSTYRTDVRL